MVTVPLHIVRGYEAMLERKAVSANFRSYYNKWVRFYLDFYQKYAFESTNGNSLPHFMDKLRQKRQSDALRKQAFHAVTLYHEMIAAAESGGEMAQGNAEEPPGHLMGDVKKSGPDVTPLNFPNGIASSNGTQISDTYVATGTQGIRAVPQEAREPQANYSREKTDARNPTRLQISSAESEGCINLKQTGASWEWIYEKLHSAIKVRHYSRKTFQAYRSWARKLQTFVKSKDPQLLSMDDVKDILSFLAVVK